MILLSMLFGCQEAAEAGICEKTCDILVMDCAYEAYPDMDSCLQGCEWRAEQGAQMKSNLGCIEEASCDTFAILECQHAWDQGVTTE